MKRTATALAAALISGVVVFGSDADMPKPPPEKPTGDDRAQGRSPDDDLLRQVRVVAAVVAYFEKNGITLKDGVVVDPKSEGYAVVVKFRTFPEGTTEKQMRDFLGMINLAYMLNVPARAAMSYPILESTDPKVKLPKLDDVPVTKKLRRLFEEYRPAAREPDKGR
jgi:hypothetical protein